MEHRVLIPTLLMSAICTTAAFALDKTHVPRKNTQAPVQQSAVVEGADNFYKSDKVTTQKVTFKNQYNMQVVGNLFIPKGHVDLYDRVNLIPWDELASFFNQHLSR